MAKKTRAPLPATLDALAVLGAQIAAARREVGWTAAELAERVGASAPVISRIENGHATTQIGTVFDAAVLCGVPLFTPDAVTLSRLAASSRTQLALLPSRVRPQRVDLDDDF
ncbi:transcriptional regulator [Nocardioides szechwanensis]|uniref:Helix-turn-helix domain-containing protein n=2 Tax=Nocardioides szechwanensis TaxID=1005944 RepID=A0A1H0CED9_9ACTN|nr:transcriptional regulator [Nocardioides szechwanensis]SDN56257.1 Helix-turn-helix domain-containing protein [Nocardioides szechwanensis]